MKQEEEKLQLKLKNMRMQRELQEKEWDRQEKLLKADEEVESAEAAEKALIGLEYEVSGLLSEVLPNKKVSKDAVATQSFSQSETQCWKISNF